MNGAEQARAAGKEAPSRRLFVYNGGFLTQRRVRRILSLAGWDIRLGLPRAGDWVGVWGNSPTAHRGERIAARRAAPLLRIEDAFLRSVLPGRAGAPPLGLLLDQTGVHFDSSRPSDLETLLAEHPLDDTALLARARAAMDWIKRAHISKYNAFDTDAALPKAPYALVIDQTRGDASIAGSGADASRFREMLYWAQEENFGGRVVIKTHPETQSGHRAGHFGPEDASDLVTLCSDPVSPWALMEGATSVYTVSSGMGFEAILAGHKPRLFGQPFYAGWGLTDDRFPIDRRRRSLTRAQLFAAVMILYPTWYDPYRDALCELEDAIATLEAQTRAWRADRLGYDAAGMRLWKRAPLQKVFGREKRLRFTEAPKGDLPVLVWASKATPAVEALPAPVHRVEDGFLRSRGLGADLIPPLSLVTDDLGIYYDPTSESRLDQLIAEAAALPPEALHRAEALVAAILKGQLSKYNLERAAPEDLPKGHRILVPGQVEDDASILKGCGEIRTNAALLQATRAANPGAVILYKPHPDVEAGLREGAVDNAEDWADAVLHQADPVDLIETVDAVWTMTSLMGFEALLRGKPVTCLGAPFYSGWGLTEDRGPVPPWRQARPTLIALAHAALIAYPRYHDPVTDQPCPPEIAVRRLSLGEVPKPGRFNRGLAKLQGAFASYAWIWRRS
ncbi:Capsular polysaccharide biosynthesis/export periplasmic protein WcbA [Candidatus Rhodobacter oscarellae]|uniref:Capsular polysaccharide biosynthesis/export periplasmic protein WcbA n=1 Tax=Candidatus Rhodobacter oscarellae TaxID=1675527 RepID=A0A0J9E6Q1_9RHOB|nr:capsular polysaccharide biosynthesis protein [Candidatus Rhodobacter lobularis]KMW58341.1 Capsular polysaccharide biosynthesis/export periplasmic protein WcbA [Candidatus Rhodobacter lobularis]